MNIEILSPQRHTIFILMIFVLAIMVESGVVSGADFSFGEVGTKNDACMSCHGNVAGIDNRTYIDPLKFGRTTHAKFGCQACHDGITTSHPDGETVAHTTSCRDCHDTVVAEYTKSAHSQYASCGGCHNPHRVFKSGDVSGDDLNRQCNGCHKKHAIVASHSRWLPQSGLHMESIACITCHSKAENYVVTINIAKHSKQNNGDNLETAAYDEMVRKAGNENLQTLIDRNRDNYISLDELRQFNRNPANKDMYLKGMMTPIKPTHAFQTFDSRWNCTFCHASGPEIMQTSYLAIPEPNGTYKKLAVEKGAVLDALHTIPDFYLMGSARNTTLNKIGLLIIAGGMVMPVGHGFLRFLSRKNRP